MIKIRGNIECNKCYSITNQYLPNNLLFGVIQCQHCGNIIYTEYRDKEVILDKRDDEN